MALLLFLWARSHFWSLAVVYRDDCQRGGVPMLLTRVVQRQAAWWILLHTAATVLAALMLVTHPALGWLYYLPNLAMTINLLTRNLRLLVKPSPKEALAMFKSSNLYLAVVLLMICVDATLTIL